MGADKREADIVVYFDVEHNKPFIVVECKKEEVSNPEYQQLCACLNLVVNSSCPIVFKLPLKYLYDLTGSFNLGISAIPICCLGKSLET
jgi:hypothetical protein